MPEDASRRKVAVWDPAQRLFHWALVALIAFSWWTAEQDIEWMDLHKLSGEVVLALIGFRILWGFVGPPHARFVDFLYGPRAVAADFRNLVRGRGPEHAGHGPIGGWLVVVLLVLVAAQAGSGLFSSDDIFVSGPLAHTVSGETEALLNKAHDVVFEILLWVAGLHIAAVVLVYPLWTRTDLVRPMITGRRSLPDAEGEPTRFSWWVGVRALVGLAVSGGAVYWLVN